MPNVRSICNRTPESHSILMGMGKVVISLLSPGRHRCVLMILQRISCPPTWKNIVISSPGVLGHQQISHRSIRSLCVSALLCFEVIEKERAQAVSTALFLCIRSTSQSVIAYLLQKEAS